MVSPMNTIVETRDLQKRFGRVKALDGLDLSMGPGEIHGFPGPKRSWKIHTLRAQLMRDRTEGCADER